MKKEIQRDFIIGDRWFYYKIYSGPKTLERVLVEIIKPICEDLVTKKIIDKWFFIRYSDPKQHIRVRFHYKKPENIAVVINSLKQPLRHYMNQDLIWKIQNDTYQREIERYGANTMELSETLFFYDSKMVVDFINMGHDEEIRWLFSLKAIDRHLDLFKFNLIEKQELLERLKIGYRNEFGKSKALNKGLSDKYRTNQEKIKDFLEPNEQESEDFKKIDDLLNQRNKKFSPMAVKIIDLKKNNMLQVDFNDLNASYIHMMMNRLFKSKNRMHEMVCYDFLNRYYKSKIARQKYA